MNDNSFIHLKDVSKFYVKGKQKVYIYDQLDMSIPHGDFLALMGPSGSGKTTLLNMMSGLDKCSSGCIEIGNINIAKLSDRKLAIWRSINVGFIFQFYNLMPVLTAEHNVELPLLLTNLTKKQRKRHVDVALEIVGISDRAKHYPRELSGGQEQRVAIARAIVSDPKILFCDEPTGDLDSKTTDDILGLLQSLNQDYGKTVIMVTHNPRSTEYTKSVINVDDINPLLHSKQVASM